MWKEWIWPLIRAAIFATGGQAVLATLASYGWHPSDWVAAMIGNVISSGAVWWWLLVIVGIVGSIIWGRIEARRKRVKAVSNRIVTNHLQKDRLALADEVTRIRMLVTRGEIPADQKTSIFAGTERYTDRLDGDPVAAFLWRDFVNEVQQFVTKIRRLKEAEANGGATGMADFVKLGTRDQIDAKASPLLRYLIDGKVSKETRTAIKEGGA